MKYAVIQTGGQQFRVQEGDVLEVAKMPVNPKDVVEFSEVLLYVDADKRLIGSPRVTGITVKASVIDHTKGEKIKVRKYKAKVRYRRVTGHRSVKTQVKINEIKSSDKKSEKAS